nr:integrase, catalytic region, zinc finger, CCHC-type, peptidase aspartic, catalytic [Tanacetum cinerariifolium]
MCEMFCQFVQKKREEKRIEEEQAAKAQNWKLPVCYDDDDDEERSNSLQDNIISELPPCSAITPNEPVDSLSMGDKHLDTILAMESDEFIKSSVENYGYSKDNCELNFKFLNNLQPEWKQYAIMMRHNKNLMGININAIYNILKQNQGDVNDVMGSKKKTVVVTSDLLALIAEKTNVSRSKEKVIVSSDSEGSEADDFSELKKITALLAKAFNRRKFYSKPTNNNLRTSSTSQSANKKHEFIKSDDKKVEKKADEKKRDMSRIKFYNYKKEGHFAKDYKKAKVKDYEYYKTKMLLANKDKDEQVLLAEDQAWMESSSDSNQEINANMVFMAQIEKVLSYSEASSSSADEKISKVSYYLSESESESEYETSEYYDNSTNYVLFVDNDDDQEIFHDAIESASENFIENHIDSQKDYDKSDVDHNDSEEKDHLVDNKDFENQNKNLQDKYDVLKNQTTTFEMNNQELNEQMKELIEKNNDLLAQTKVLKDQLQVKHVVIDTHVECQEKYAKLEAKRYEYMIRYSAYFDNDKQHRKQIADQQVLYDKMSVQLVELDKHVRDLKNMVLEKDFKISELEECTVHMIMPSKDNLYNGRKRIGFENMSYFEKAKDLRTTLYDEKSSKVIAPGMFKLNVSQCISQISMSKSSCDSNNVEIKLKRKRHLDTFSSVRRPKNSGVMWKKKGSSNTSNVGLSAIIDSGCSKHMTGNRALLTNFVEKFLETVCFGNNDFAVIAGYGDVVIVLMTIKKVYYVEVLGHNLFSVGQFCDKGLEVAFRKSTCFV